MGLRFRKSVKLFPGIRLNLGKKGASVTVGRRGASMTFGKKRTRTNIGIPGTGLSWTSSGKSGCAVLLFVGLGLACAVVVTI